MFVKGERLGAEVAEMVITDSYKILGKVRAVVGQTIPLVAVVVVIGSFHENKRTGP